MSEERGVNKWGMLAKRIVHRPGFKKQYNLEELQEKFIEYVDFYSQSREAYIQRSRQKKGGSGSEVQAERVERVSPMTEWSFCLWIGKDRSWLNGMIMSYREMQNKNEEEEAYLEFLEQLKTFLNSQLLEGAILGEYTPVICASLLRLKKNIDVTSNGQTAAVPVINIVADTASREEYQAAREAKEVGDIDID